MNYFIKIKKWFGYNPPNALTWEEWRIFDKEFKKNAPIRFFIKKIFLVRLNVMKRRYIIDPILWIKYRTTRRFHIINTGLKPGYYDKDHIMLHGNFSLLKNYVEIECASMYEISNGKNKVDAGIKHLEWEISLGDESPKQSAAAKEILELYKWWTITRVNRKEVESPINLKEARKNKKWNDTFFDLMESFEIDGSYKKYLDDHHKQSEAWDKEDDEMLIRLIKIRKSLWT